MEVGGERYYYIYCDTVTIKMIPALRWAAMGAILMFQYEVMDKVTRQCPSHKTVSNLTPYH